MKRVRTPHVLLVLWVASSLFVAAGAQAATHTSQSKAACITVPTKDGSLARVSKSGTLNVGEVDAELPYSSSDPKNPGYEIEIAKYLATQLCLKMKPVFVSFAGLIPALNTHRFDIVVQGMAITPERAKVVSFSNPDEAYGATIVVKSGNPEHIKSLADLKGKNVGVLSGAVELPTVQKTGAHVKQYTNQNEILLDLGNGRLDAAYLEIASALWAKKQAPTLKIEVVKGFVPPSLYYGAVVLRKGDTDLRNAINLAIARLLKSGARDRIMANYGLRSFPLTGAPKTA
jgi:ABC-type amino acid transport substrate-binding protein